jgi:hypothetical protein
MLKTATFTLLAATAAMSLASSAYAQGDRYGSPLPNYYDSSGGLKWGSWGPDQQGSSGGSQGQATTGNSQGNASGNRSQNAGRTRGYGAYGYAPERRR